MKHLILSITGLLIVNLTQAQDTLYTRNGDVINAKVAEITQLEIKYKKTSNPDGPLYTIDKDEVALIHYKNGSKDVFTENSSTNMDPQNQQPLINNNYYQSQNNGYRYGYGRRVRVYVGPSVYVRTPGFYYGHHGFRGYRHFHWRWH